MARINIEDQFWIEITAVTKRLKGDETRAVGDAVRLFRIAQQRAKAGRIVSDEDWRIGEFSEALIGIFALKVEGGYEVVGAKKHFGWLSSRVEAGRQGGIKSGEARRSEINNLDEANGSKPEQTEPSPSYSPSLGSKDPNINILVKPPKQEEFEANPHQWIIDLWNSLRGPMREVKVLTKGTKRHKQVLARLKTYPDPNSWNEIFTKAEASDFVTGRNGEWFGGGFDWIMESDLNIEKILNGNYKNKTKEVKKDTWLEAADKVVKALKEVGSYDNNSADKLTNLLGPKLFQIALKTKGGFSQMRMMKDDDYRNRKIAGLLKASYEDLKQQGVL